MGECRNCFVGGCCSVGSSSVPVDNIEETAGVWALPRPVAIAVPVEAVVQGVPLKPGRLTQRAEDSVRGLELLGFKAHAVGGKCGRHGRHLFREGWG